MPQYTPEGYEKDRAVLGLLGDLAREKNATMAQISLAWMLCKKPWIIPIPGSRKPERLRENLGAVEVELTAEEIARIDAALDGMDLAVFGGHARAWGPARVQGAVTSGRQNAVFWAAPTCAWARRIRGRHPCARRLDIFLTWSRLQGLRCPRQLTVE